jgi:ATP-binding cassette, subfamily B, bacterial PglK
MLKNKLRKIISHIPLHRKKQGRMLLWLMLISGGSEMISLGAVLPFLAVLTDPNMVYNHEIAQPFIQFFDLRDASQMILPLTLFFSAAVVVTAAIRISMLYVITRLSFAIGADLSVDIYNRTLHQSYEVHTRRNSSEIINGVTQKINIIVNSVLIPILTIVSSVILVLFILIALFFVDWFIALLTLIIFGAIYWGIIKLTRHKLSVNGEIIAKKSSEVIKALQEGMGGIRDVLLGNLQSTYCQIYRESDLPIRKAQGENQFIGRSPRYFVEALGMILMIIASYIMIQREDPDLIIPVLGVLVLGAQRLLPLLQQSYSSLSQIKGSEATLDDALSLLDQPIPNYSKEVSLSNIEFNNKIRLKGLGYQYNSNNSWIFRDMDLTIKKGSCVGFMGETGSGKSTLIDVIMGLLEPTEGYIVVDDKVIEPDDIFSWRAQIAHVPQNVYLIDGTIEENIAFGFVEERVSHARVQNAARQAHISELIDSWPDQYNTHVGENGIKLSGGQRQRIGIARALFQEKKIIILDEATSALDNQTESKVMDAIRDLDNDITILIIAHRLTTLKGCDEIHELFLNKNSVNE